MLWHTELYQFCFQMVAHQLRLFKVTFDMEFISPKFIAGDFITEQTPVFPFAVRVDDALGNVHNFAGIVL